MKNTDKTLDEMPPPPPPGSRAYAGVHHSAIVGGCATRCDGSDVMPYTAYVLSLFRVVGLKVLSCRGVDGAL